MKKAYLSIYLSLVLTLLISLIFVLMDGARKNATKMRLECITDISMNSVLGEYNKALLEQYDLLFVDSAYGKENPNIQNVNAHLQHYLNKNMQPTNLQKKDMLKMHLAGTTIDQYSIASDNYGAAIKREIGDYMSLSLAGFLGEHIPDSLLKLTDLGQSWSGITSKRQQNQSILDSAELPTQEVEEGVFEEVALNNPADKANQTRTSGILNIVLDDTATLSKERIDPSRYISHRDCMKGTGVEESVKGLSEPCNELVLDEYLFEKLGYYGETMEKSLMKYQIEYLIGGESLDWKNLEVVAKKILAWREVANVTYLFSDGGKQAQAEAVAAALTAVILKPELLEPVKISILFAWAYVESLQDIKILLEGGRVPTVKSAESWHTQLDDLLHVKQSLRHISNTTGQSYQDYLRAILLMQNVNTKTFRMMDIMEMDIRKTPGNSMFRLDGCIDIFKASIVIQTDYGYENDISRTYGYFYYR